MAVSANDLKIGPVIPANGVSLISLDFFFEDETLIQVFKTGNPDPLVLEVDYTVAGAGTETGSVTLTVPANGTDQYAIFLVPELERSSDLQLRGQFQSEPFNVELDRIWQALQALNTRISRAILLSETSVPALPLVAESTAARAGKVPIFGADGVSLELGPAGSEIENAEAAAAAAAAALSAAEAAQAAAEASAAAAELKEQSMLADRGAWVTATAYAPSDLYTFDGQTYVTEIAHTSSSVAADLAASKVRIFAAKGASGAGTGDMQNADNLAFLASPSISRTNLGLGAMAVLDDVAFADLDTGALATSAGGGIAAFETDDDRIPTAKAVAEAIAAGAAASDYLTKTWQSVTRVHSTNYQNANDYPLDVIGWWSAGGNAHVFIDIGPNTGAYVQMMDVGISDRVNDQSASFTVPPGWYYRFRRSHTDVVVQRWSERSL